MRIKSKCNKYEKFVYYVPSCNANAQEHESIKISYFNNKMLQTLNGYVSLENKTANFYKDLAHH